MLAKIRGLTAVLATGGIVVVLAGFLGHLHPALDTAAAFRVQAAIGFVALFLFTVAFSALVARSLALVGAFLALAGIGPSLRPGPPVAVSDMTVYSHNLRFDNPIPQRVVAEIESSSADIVLLQEVSEANLAIPRSLRARTEVICEFSGIGAVAILSRFPMIGEPGCGPGEGAAWARLRTPDGPVTAVSIHLPWPYPYRQAEQAREVAGLLSDLPEPIVIAGDFNNAPWSEAVDVIRAATGTRTTSGLRLTFQRPSFWPGLPLDHVLLSEDLVGETRGAGLLGSDHIALLTEVRFR